ETDHRGLALPMARGMAVPLADIGRQMRATVHDDVALPSLSLTDVVVDGNAACRLDNAPKRVAAKLGQPGGHAAHRRWDVLRIMMAVHASYVVTRRLFFEPGRARRIVLASVTCRLLVLACLGRLQQGNAKCAFGSGELLRLRGRRWKPPIGRIDDPRRTYAR